MSDWFIYGVVVGFSILIVISFYDDIKNLLKSFRRWFFVVGIILMVLLFPIIDYFQLDEELLANIGRELAPNGSDYEIAYKLMNYSHYGPGDCVDKSFLFERLAHHRGLTVRHIVLKGPPGSHATSQVKIGGEWLFFDTTENKVMKLQDYRALNLTTANKHINCIDGACTNYAPPSMFVALVAYIRPIN